MRPKGFYFAIYHSEGVGYTRWGTTATEAQWRQGEKDLTIVFTEGEGSYDMPACDCPQKAKDFLWISPTPIDIRAHVPEELISKYKLTQIP